jgi:hypothetical protein
MQINKDHENHEGYFTYLGLLPMMMSLSFFTVIDQTYMIVIISRPVKLIEIHAS